MDEVEPFFRRLLAEVDLDVVRRAAKRMAIEASFCTVAIEETQLIALELATNAFKYGTDAMMSIEAVSSHLGSGIRLTVSDSGPGIPDMRLAFTSRYSSSGSLGEGLEIVSRLSDEVDASSGSSGTVIIATKWAHRTAR